MEDDIDDYVFFGTPLPEIEDESVLRKKAAKELQVRDEKGRQRFHGAFTGGFSAGYFNTVDTKEGWAPSTFISSRSKLSDRIQQNPEDFMDDEDFGEFGIATKKIHTTTNFQDTSDTDSRKRNYIDTDTVIPGEAPLKDFIQPVRESIGMIILKKLGWRQGQGIGPRVKKHSSGIKVYGCLPFAEAVVPEEEDDPMLFAFTFAPKDTMGMLYKPKDNYFGLGYSGLSKQSVLQASIDPFSATSTKSWLAKDKKKITITGQAFGVGAFEDDDDDMYRKDDMSQYDFSDLTLKGSDDSHKTIESSKCGISQDVLEGFHLASQPSSIKKHYPCPILPHNFKPIHLKSVSSVSQNVNLNKSRHALSAYDRSLLLGEKKFQKASSKVPDASVESKNSIFEKTCSPSISSTNSLNFQPFPNDSSKQQRYEEYLRLKKTGDVEKLVQPTSMTEWEKQQEIEEFSKAAVLFKPLSNVLSSRFESRSHLSLEHEVMSAIEKLKKKEENVNVTKKNLVGTSNRTTLIWHPVPLLCKRMNVPNPYPNSSSSGSQNISKSKSVFDHLSFTDEKQTILEKAELPILDTSTNLENKSQDVSKNAAVEIPTTSKQMSNTAIPDKNIDVLSTEVKRPPMDFFKDIFENSSSDEDVTVEEKIDTPDKKISSEKEISVLDNPEDFTEKNTSSSPKSIDKDTQLNKKIEINSSNPQNSSTANKKVGFGVFANLDLDALNQRTSNKKPVHQNVSNSENNKMEIDLTSDLDDDIHVKEQPKNDMYGPELPPNFSSPPLSVASSSKDSSRKRMKHKLKHKHHKHKSKKKKKSSRRNSSSSDESEELDDIPPSLLIEKIKKLQKRKG